MKYKCRKCKKIKTSKKNRILPEGWLSELWLKNLKETYLCKECKEKERIEYK